MSLCVSSAAVALALALDAFTLAWTHSVERTEWQEDWAVQGDALQLVRARVRGSGAGMEPPPGAVLDHGWWVYTAERRVSSLRLAVSGATGSGWRLCAPLLDGCRDLEAWLREAGAAPLDAIDIRPGRCAAALGARPG